LAYGADICRRRVGQAQFRFKNVFRGKKIRQDPRRVKTSPPLVGLRIGGGNCPGGGRSAVPVGPGVSWGQPTRECFVGGPARCPNESPGLCPGQNVALGTKRWGLFGNRGGGGWGGGGLLFFSFWMICRKKKKNKQLFGKNGCSPLPFLGSPKTGQKKSWPSGGGRTLGFQKEKENLASLVGFCWFGGGNQRGIRPKMIAAGGTTQTKAPTQLFVGGGRVGPFWCWGPISSLWGPWGPPGASLSMGGPLPFPNCLSKIFGGGETFPGRERKGFGTSG